MGILTDEMKRVVTEIQLCYAATVTPDGKPNLSPKGSITVLSDDELGFADLASPWAQAGCGSGLGFCRSSYGALGSSPRVLRRSTKFPAVASCWALAPATRA
jgi:hypothetical protein